jgi:ribosomal protein L7/L12
MSFLQPNNKDLADTLGRIEHKLDVLINALGADANLGLPIDDELRDIRTEKGDIQAIKRCRELTGWGLKEALVYIERL